MPKELITLKPGDLFVHRDTPDVHKVIEATDTFVICRTVLAKDETQRFIPIDQNNAEWDPHADVTPVLIQIHVNE